jgi:hypothetical protein
MFKYVLSLTFAVGFAAAATISTIATCDGVTTVGTDLAVCNDGRMEARAAVGAPLIASRADSFGVSLHAGVVGLTGGGFASATANFSDDYVFTVSGGSGNGFFFPLFVLDHNGGTAGISFAGIGGPPCLPDIVSCSKPFTFGVPQIVAIGMGGEAFGVSTRVGDADAHLDQILFFDPSGNDLSNVAFTLVSVDLPEPSVLSLLSIGLIFLALSIRGVRFRGHFHLRDLR